MIYKWKRVELLESKKRKEKMPVAYFLAFWCADTLVQAALCSLPPVRQKLTRFATPPFSFNLLRSVKRGALRARKPSVRSSSNADCESNTRRSPRLHHVGTDYAPFRFFFAEKSSHAPSFLLFRPTLRSKSDELPCGRKTTLFFFRLTFFAARNKRLC